VRAGEFSTPGSLAFPQRLVEVQYWRRTIPEHAPAHVRKQLTEVGWTIDGSCPSWLGETGSTSIVQRPGLCNVVAMPKQKFKREVEKELTGRETERSEIVGCKL
jgi:hypothetical protein